MNAVPVPSRRFKADSKPAQNLTPGRIIRTLRAGARLCRHHGRAGGTYTLQPPGLRVEPEHALAAIAGGALEPAGDGLFPGYSQSWTARKAQRKRRVNTDTRLR